MNLEKRIACEKAIARKFINSAIALGYKISVNDGENFVVSRSVDVKSIMHAMFSTDEDHLIVRTAEGKLVGSATFIYGNDGFDVIADHTDTEAFNEIMNHVQPTIERWEKLA